MALAGAGGRLTGTGRAVSGRVASGHAPLADLRRHRVGEGVPKEHFVFCGYRWAGGAR
ncbi:hypothetical protein GCM10010466_22850 [Planomonospora alba]|uniref:Uncharacterized protein n=1 Tax=Planomonospora alba TaxID=161354 RepID=A0ABP6N1Y4_9ACTN